MNAQTPRGRGTEFMRVEHENDVGRQLKQRSTFNSSSRLQVMGVAEIDFYSGFPLLTALRQAFSKLGHPNPCHSIYM